MSDDKKDLRDLPFDYAAQKAKRRGKKRGLFDRDWLIEKAKAEQGYEVGAGPVAAEYKTESGEEPMDRKHDCDCPDRGEDRCPRHGAVAPRAARAHVALEDKELKEIRARREATLGQCILDQSKSPPHDLSVNDAWREFWAHAPDDIARLLDEVERQARETDLQMLRVKACEHIAEGEEGWEKLINECPSTRAVATLKAENERLRVALRTSLVSKELHGDLPIYKCGDIELMKTESGWSLYPPRHGEPLRGLSEFHLLDYRACINAAALDAALEGE